MGWCLGGLTMEKGLEDSLSSKMEKNQQRALHTNVDVPSVTASSCKSWGGGLREGAPSPMHEAMDVFGAYQSAVPIIFLEKLFILSLFENSLHIYLGDLVYYNFGCMSQEYIF